MHIVPGGGIDFAAVSRVLAVVAAIYRERLVQLAPRLHHGRRGAAGGLALRRDVDLKLARLPLKYFDDHARGDILSRVTNDIDNIANTLQQTLTQIITAVFTLIGVLIMMFSISPMLAKISLVTVPLSVIVTMFIAKRSQRQFKLAMGANRHSQRVRGGDATGHNLVKVFGRGEETVRAFDEHNEQLYQASFKAQFISGIIMPAMFFIGNLNYVAICVLGGLRVATARSPWGMSRPSFSTRGSSHNPSPRWRAWPTCCSRPSPRRSGYSSCWMKPRSRPKPRSRRSWSSRPATSASRMCHSATYPTHL